MSILRVIWMGLFELTIEATICILITIFIKWDNYSVKLIVRFQWMVWKKYVAVIQTNHIFNKLSTPKNSNWTRIAGLITQSIINQLRLFYPTLMSTASHTRSEWTKCQGNLSANIPIFKQRSSKDRLAFAAWRSKCLPARSYYCTAICSTETMSEIKNKSGKTKASMREVAFDSASHKSRGFDTDT